MHYKHSVPGSTDGTVWLHRKLAASQGSSGLQNVAVTGQNLILLGSGFVILAFIVVCGIICSTQTKVKEGKEEQIKRKDTGRSKGSRKSSGAQNVQLDYIRHSNASGTSSQTGSRTTSTNLGNTPSRFSQLGPAQSGMSSNAERSRSLGSDLDFRPRISGVPTQASRRTDSSNSRQGGSTDGRTVERQTPPSKPPLPTLIDASDARQVAKVPLQLSVKAQHQSSPMSSPWEGRPSIPKESPFRAYPYPVPLKPPAPSDSAESIGSQMGRAPSSDVISYPPAFGRRHTLMVRGIRQPSFSLEEEDAQANMMENAGREAWARNNPGVPEQGLGTRVRLNDVKLKCKNGVPIVLGQGGFGRVYLGTLNREDCAVKTVLEGSRREQARFLREIRLLENLRTSYITRYMGWSVCPEGFVLLMEYLPGGNLAQALKKDDSDYQYYKRGKEAMLSIALALNHIHGRRICHFDIKSPNVLLAKDGQAKLADVGLSKLVKDDATAMSRPGTYSYAAPEQLQGKAGSAADIWAFGTCLWEVCTCEAPPANRMLREIDVPEEAPEEVVALIDACHAQIPKKRPTAEEVYTMLKACTWPAAEE